MCARPEPAVGRGDSFDPEHETLLAESVGLAMLVVLDTLAPAERVAFVLHDMFDVPFDEIASILGALAGRRAPVGQPRAETRARTGAPRRSRSPPPGNSSSMPISPPRAKATSMRCSHSWIPTSCSTWIAPRCRKACRERSAELESWWGARSHTRHGRGALRLRSSTERWASWSWRRWAA